MAKVPPQSQADYTEVIPADKNELLALYRSILDSNPNLFYIKDLAGKYMMANKALADLFEVSPTELLERLNSDFPLDDGSIEFYNKQEKDVVKHGKAFTIIERFVSPSGTEYWFHTHKTPLRIANGNTYILVNSTDITERVKAETALRQSETLYRGLMKSTFDYIFLIDRQFRIKTVNDSVAIALNTDAEQLTGINLVEIIEKYAGIEAKEVIAALQTNLPLKEERLIDNEWYEIFVFPLRNDQGAFEYIAVNAKNISLLKKAEKDIRKSLQHEQDLNQLKSGVISTVSHEFRTPLTVINSNVQLLDRYYNEMTHEQLRNRFRLISNSIQHLQYMLDNISLLDIHQRGILRPTPEVVNLQEFCHSLTDELNSISLPMGRVKLLNLCQQKNTVIDRKLVRHIMTNLLTNALKYSPVDTKVLFKVEDSSEQNIKFTIQDKGIGIEEKEMRNIWEPFYRGTNTSGIKGTGIGNSIVKSCVEMLSGTITIDSRLHEGTTVEVILPAQPVKVISKKPAGDET